MSDSPDTTILIAEDEKPMLKALREKFTHEGFKVIEAKDGDKALKLALKQHPRIILLDLVMPKMDGLAMLKKLREDEWGKGVPVVILTNLGIDDRKIREIMRYEPSFYLVKSDVRLDEIISKIKEIIGN